MNKDEMALVAFTTMLEAGLVPNSGLAQKIIDNAIKSQTPIGFLWRAKGSNDPWKFQPGTDQLDNHQQYVNTEFRVLYALPL